MAADSSSTGTELVVGRIERGGSAMIERMALRTESAL
jgi:hypothetical protein